MDAGSGSHGVPHLQVLVGIVRTAAIHGALITGMQLGDATTGGALIIIMMLGVVTIGGALIIMSQSIQIMYQEQYLIVHLQQQ